MKGAYAIGVISAREPQTLVAAREGSPLVVGLGDGENFIASDIFALVDETKRFIFLEDGDIAALNTEEVVIYDKNGVQRSDRAINETKLSSNAVDRGTYRHFMQKEIHEQPVAVEKCLDGRIHSGRLLETDFGHEAEQAFSEIKAVQIVACGTSYHAGMVARYWM